jgi:dTDP-4-dehydrorhamnose 3,5-epimerase-like enzyme
MSINVEGRGWEMPTRQDSKGEENVLFTRAGFSRGGHVHRKTLEALTVLTGVIRVEIKDTFGRLRWSVAQKGSTVILSLNHAHVFYAPQDSIVLQTLDRPYDPEDDIPCRVSDYDVRAQT